MEAIATVVAVSGKAYARNADGELREIRPGDVLLEGETVVTPDGGTVELSLSDGSPIVIDVPELTLTTDMVADLAPGADESAVQDETVEQVLAALESGEDLGDVLDATAAGPGSASGPGGEGHSFIRLGRIAEETDEFSGILGSQAVESDPVIDPGQGPVDAIDDFETTAHNTPVTIDIEDNDLFFEGEDVVSITQPENGVAVLNDDDTVTYTPNDGFAGTDTFTYTAINPNGSQGDTAVVTVVVGAAPPIINIGDDVVIEGNTALVTVSLNKSWDEAVTVSFATADDTATVSGGDYDAASGTITFQPGVTEIVVTVSTNVDNLREGSEFLDINLSNPINASIGDGQGQVEIVDVYELPTISIGNDSVVEGQDAEVVVSLSRAVEEEVSVEFVSADGTAIELNGDYIGTSGTLTFEPGETELRITVVTLDDSEVEPTEYMYLDLSNPSNATIADPQGEVEIRDNDVPVTNEPPQAQDAQVTVDEAALDLDEDGDDVAPGTVIGSNAGSTAETVEGQLNATDPDGDFLTFAAGTQVGDYGTLQVSANGSFVYTLTSPYDTQPDVNDGVQTEFGRDQFQVLVSDGNGGTDLATITVNIIDDVPSLDIDDTDPTEVVEDAASPITGDISVVEGADQDGTLDITLTTGTLSSAISITLDGVDDEQSATVNNGTQDLGVLKVTYTGATGAVTWSFDPQSVDNDLADSFEMVATITDADGDQDVDTHTVTVNDGADPEDSAPISLSVDEDDLPAGSSPNAPVTDTKSLNFVEGSDAWESIKFSTDLSNLETSTDTVAGQEIWWSRESDTQIKGFLDAGKTILAVTLDLTVTNLATGQADVKMTLSQELMNKDGDDIETTLALGYVNVVAKDVDDDSVNGKVTIGQVDDIPSVTIVEADGGADNKDTVAEDAASPITGSITAVEGADQDATLDITLTTGTLSSAISFTLDGVDDEQSATVNNGTQDLGVLTVTYTGATGAVTWSFDPQSVDNDLADSFEMVATITDADGDQDVDKHTVTVNDGAAPKDSAPISLSVDEDDLPDGSSPNAPVTDTKSLNFVEGSDAWESIKFSTDLSNLETSTDTLAGQEIWWSRESDTQIKGFLDAGKTILAITLDLTVTNLATGQADVKMTLSQELLNKDGDDIETTLALGYVNVEAKDIDDDTVNGKVTIGQVDDIPSVDIDDTDPTSVAEDAVSAITGDITAVEGADQDGTLDITLTTGTLSSAISITLDGVDDEQSATVNNGTQDLGVLTVTYTGATGAVTWSFDPQTVDNDLADSFEMVATITDTDGDQDVDKHTVTVNDGTAPQDSAPISLSVDEDDLPDGSSPNAPVTDTKSLNFVEGSDAWESIKFSTDLSNLETSTDTLAGQEIWWSRESDTQIKGFLDAGKTILAITLDLTVTNLATGQADVKMTLSKELMNAYGDDIETTLGLGFVNVEAKDVDDDTVNGKVTIGQVDDIPSVIYPTVAVLSNEAGQYDVDVALDLDIDVDNNVGADQPGTLTFTVPNGTAVTGLNSEGEDRTFTVDTDTIYYYKAAGSTVLYGSLWQSDDPDFDPDAPLSGADLTALTSVDNLVFTITLYQGAGTYDFDLHQKIDPELTEFTVAENGHYVIKGGAVSFVTFDIPDQNPVTNPDGLPDLLLTPLDVSATTDGDGNVTSVDSILLGGILNEKNGQVGANTGGPIFSFEEGARVNYVIGISGDPVSGQNPGYDPTDLSDAQEAHFFTEHAFIDHAAVTVSDVKSGTAIIRVQLFNENYDPLVATPNPADPEVVRSGSQTTVAVDGIIIRTALGETYVFTEVGGASGDNPGTRGDLSVTFNGDGTATIFGLITGDQIAADGASGYNAAEYVHMNGADFGLGGFGGLVPGEETAMTFNSQDLALTDADGDVVYIPDGLTIDILPGSTNVLDAGADSPLIGTADEDDVFVFELADLGNSESVSTFDDTPHTDSLDLRDILQGEGPDASAADLTSYLNVYESGGSTVIEISSDGTGAFSGSPGDDPASVDQTITLSGVDLATGHGDLESIISDMLTNGQLITD